MEEEFITVAGKGNAVLVIFMRKRKICSCGCKTNWWVDKNNTTVFYSPFFDHKKK